MCQHRQRAWATRTSQSAARGSKWAGEERLRCAPSKRGQSLTSEGYYLPCLDLSRAPYVVYGVKYIDLLSLCALPLYSLLSTIPLCSAPLFATSKSVQSLTPEGILNHCYKAGPYGIQGECDIYIYIYIVYGACGHKRLPCL